jgi:hypothetical protein
MYSSLHACVCIYFPARDVFSINLVYMGIYLHWKITLFVNQLLQIFRIQNMNVTEKQIFYYCLYGIIQIHQYSASYKMTTNWNVILARMHGNASWNPIYIHRAIVFLNFIFHTCFELHTAFFSKWRATTHTALDLCHVCLDHTLVH